MKLISCISLCILLSVHTSKAQNFTVIDSLPDGAYGTAAWGDFDGDGWKDLAYLTQAIPDAICKVYHNTGNVFIETTQHFPLLFNPGARWADLNNDGFDDLVVNGMDSTLQCRTFIYKSLGNGTFVSMPNSVFPLASGGIDITDYNNDGLKDIAVAGMDSVGGNHAFIYKNLGGFNFTDIHASLTGIHFGEVKWGDYNKDNLPDLVINGIGNSDFRVRVYKNMGADNFQLQPWYMKGSAGTVDWTDLDNDGWLDILVTGYDSTSGNNFTELHHNNGNGTFSVVATNLPDFGEPSGVAIADYNMDGHKDLCFIGGSSNVSLNGSALAIYTSANSYQVQPFFNGNIINPIIRSTDMDHDGDDDLIFGNLILRNELVSGLPPVKSGNTEASIYPNPAHDNIRIQSYKAIAFVSIMDVSGKQIQTISGVSLTGEITIEHLDAAVFFLKISYKDGSAGFQKLLLVH